MLAVSSMSSRLSPGNPKDQMSTDLVACGPWARSTASIYCARLMAAIDPAQRAVAHGFRSEFEPEDTFAALICAKMIESLIRPSSPAG